jgi:hypothetical protein
MNTRQLHFSCPHCQARIKAPVQLSGQRRNCPGCGHALSVPYTRPEDAGPLLVLLEANEHFSLGVPRSAGRNWARVRQSA